MCETPRYNIDDLRLSQLTSHEIEQEISQLELLCPKPSSAFSSAINVSYEKTISDFLLRQEDAYIELIGSWIKRLGKQIEVISQTSITQKSNIDLVITILGSIQRYDEDLYRQVSDKVGSSMEQLHISIQHSGQFLITTVECGFQTSSTVVWPTRNQGLQRLLRKMSGLLSIATTQEKQKEVDRQLHEIRKILSSFLSGKLTTIKNKIDNLNSEALENEKESKRSLKWGLIFLATGLFAEALAVIILVLLTIGFIALGASLQG